MVRGSQSPRWRVPRAGGSTCWNLSHSAEGLRVGTASAPPGCALVTAVGAEPRPPGRSSTFPSSVKPISRLVAPACMESFKNRTFLGKKQFRFLKGQMRKRKSTLAPGCCGHVGGPGSLGQESWGPRLHIRSLVNAALEVLARWRGRWGQCQAAVLMLLPCPAAACRRPLPWGHQARCSFRVGRPGSRLSVFHGPPIFLTVSKVFNKRCDRT